MEFHPMLEKGNAPNPGLWYVLSAVGEHPSMRVGHTATFIAGDAGAEGKIYFIAGATPDGQLSDMYVLDLETFSWDTCECSGLKARYEHIAFTTMSEPRKIYVLLGAEKTGNLNDVQVYDTERKVWVSVVVQGSAPSARTHHTSAVLADRVYVYSGGAQGVDPVHDRQLYYFDASTSTWSSVTTDDAPKPRHGHVLLAHDNHLILHGGMNGPSFYDDLHVLDLNTNKWRQIRARGRVFPPNRAGHGATIAGKHAYIFGGMNKDGALDDMYRLDLRTYRWQRVDIGGPAPTPRLDFAMTSLMVRVPNVADSLASSKAQAQCALEKLRVLSMTDGEISTEVDTAEEGAGEGGDDDDPSSELSQLSTGGLGDELVVEGSIPPNPTPNTECYRQVWLIMVNGGMDTQGEIWDDSLVFLADGE